jgi:hypothetical protein
MKKPTNLKSIEKRIAREMEGWMAFWKKIW